MMREQVAKAVKTAVKSQFKQDINPEITYPAAQFGDVATNAAFILAKPLKRSPQQIANELAGAIKDKNIAAVEVAGGGFLNIRLQDSFWIAQLKKIDANYATNNREKNQKIQIEFISANPTGPLTLGNARGGFIGDVLANIFDQSGHRVTREYYFNDAGSQIDQLVESVKAEAGLVKVEHRQYAGDYIKDLVNKHRSELSLKTDSILGRTLAQDVFKTHIQPVITRMGIKFDVTTNERTLNTQYQAVSKALGELIVEKDGASWLLSTGFGDKRDRVLTKASGERTYLANDLAYHYQIFGERGFDRAIKIWGADHAGQVPSLKLTIQNLFPQKQLDFVILQWVRLVKGGKVVSMSKRAGTYVTVDELLDEVPAEVARFFFLMRSADTHMDFDLDLAKEESQKNPFHYVMYAYSRARSILNQAKQRGLKIGTSLDRITPLEKLIIRQLLRLPELVEEISTTYQVHQLTFYGMELAKLFHDYYEAGRIIDLPPDQAVPKLFFIKQFSVALEAYWALLGIKPRAKM